MARSLLLVTLAAVALATPLGSGATSAPLPGDGRIAFAASTGIASMNPDGSGQWGVELNLGDSQPAWSPDGSQLAVVTHWAGQSGILVMQPNGSLAHLVTTDPGDNGPAWSPSGSQLAFVNNNGLFVVNADGTGRRLLWSAHGYLGRPTWSPDGGKVALRASSDDPTTSGIDVVDLATTTATTIVTDQQAGYPSNPAWSPDGSRIAFTGGGAIWTISPDGKNLIPLVGSTTGYSDEAAWSPDGQQIAFDHNSQIWLMHADGTGARQLTSGDWTSSPAWQPLPPAPAGCSLWGTTGNDLLVGTDAPDVICGGAGDDTLIGLGGNDILRGHDGNDTIAGGTGLDYLDGGPGDDTLDGRDGGDADTLDGGPGRDTGTIDGKIDTMGSIERPRVDADLAAWQPVTASRFAPTNPPARAVDGDISDWWNSGNYPTQWLEVDLRSPRQIGSVRMITMDYPSGGSVLLLGRTRLDQPYHLLHAFRGPMADMQLVTFAPKKPWRKIRYLRLYVPPSPSGVGWVAWHELSVYAPKPPPRRH